MGPKKKKLFHSASSFSSIKRRLKNKFSFEQKPQIAFMNFSIKNAQSSVQSSLMVLYGITLFILGAVIPISDAFASKEINESGDHKYYLEVFFLILYISGIFGVCFLQLVVFLAEKNKKTQNKERKAKLSKSSEACEVFDSNVPILEVDENSITPYEEFSLNKTEEEQTSLKRSRLHRSATDPTEMETLPRQNVKFEFDDRSIVSSRSEGLNNSETRNTMRRSRHLDEIVSTSAEGINLYLRLGAVGFGFGVMIHDGFKISDQWNNENPHCRSLLWTPKHMVHFIYTFVQTYFLFKYHHIGFNRQKAIMRLVLCHMALINVCQWLKTVVFEIREEMGVRQQEKSNTTLNSNGTIIHLCHGYSDKLSPYLFPCAIEYSLITAAVFYKMFQKVGQAKLMRNSLSSYTSQNYTDEEKTPQCHKSHKGLFVGLLLFMATLVAIALFFLFVDKEEKQSLALIVHQSTQIVLLVVSLIACIAAHVVFRRLQFQSLTPQGAFDGNLLLIGLAGMISYNVFLFVPVMEQLHTSMIAHLYGMKSLLEICQTLTQVFFILEASRRCSKNLKQTQTKPGRAMVTFLLAANLTMWIVNTFEVKRVKDHPMHISFYSNLPWTIITRLLLPLVIFFRFHSTVCLSDLWTKAYRQKALD